MFENVSKISRKEVRDALAAQREKGAVVQLYACRRHSTKGAFEFAQKTGTRVQPLETLRAIEEGRANFSDEAYVRISLAPLPTEIETQLAEDEYFGWNPEEAEA